MKKKYFKHFCLIFILIVIFSVSLIMGVTYSKYSLSYSKDASVLVLQSNYCVNNNLTFAECILYANTGEKDIETAKTKVKEKSESDNTKPSFSSTEPTLLYTESSSSNYTISSSQSVFYSTNEPTLNNTISNNGSKRKGSYVWDTVSTTRGTLKEIYDLLQSDEGADVYYTCNNQNNNTCNQQSYYILTKDNLTLTSSGTTTITYKLSGVERHYSYVVETSADSPGLYATEDLGNTTSYYFRGSVTNNYVKFGKSGTSDICFRIIRINGDGNIRIIYSGVADSNGVCTATGSKTQIGTSAFNNNLWDVAYTSYMYDLSSTSYMETSSTSYLTYSGIAPTTSYKFYQEASCNDESQKCSLSGGVISGIWYDTADKIINGYYTEVSDLYSLSNGNYVQDDSGNYILLNDGSYAKIDGSKYTLTDGTYTVSESGNYYKVLPYKYTCWSTSSNTCTVYSEVKSKVSSTTYVKVQAKVIYRGYMTQDMDSVRNNTTDSDIKKVVDNWYKNNMLDYADYLGDSIFCIDRTVYSGYSSELGKSINEKTSGITRSNLNKTIGNLQNNIVLRTYRRLINEKSPSLLCGTDVESLSDNANKKQDLFTVNDIENGNGDLTYPVGLITADEVSLAGGVAEQYNSKFYLTTGSNYWTASPSHLSSWSGYSYVWNVLSDGYFGYSWSAYAFGVRPVLNLKSDVMLSGGDGTQSNPYQITLKV